MNTPGLIKNFEAGAAVTKHRIVKFGSGDELAVQAAAATDALIGVSTEVDSASGDRVDVIMSGIAQVEFGGNVTRGAALTSDANGKAVAAAPATGVNNRIIGWAAVSGADGDIGSVILAPGEIQGE
ncbi:capsid cement protein [Gracilimonas tropica]|uniref:capsid cement protein n=1 Tax=Gracilimonas tropica TaxID=454600 RepID=UPI0003647B6F|nr:capsid cement protein [Gracilimonas tropica]